MSTSAIIMMVLAIIFLWGGSAYFLSKAIKDNNF